MGKATGGGRRILGAVEALGRGDHEGAMLHLSALVDATGKRMGFNGTRNRCQGFIKAHEPLIQFLYSGGMISVEGPDQMAWGGMTLADALYKLVRCPVVHEGEIPDVTWTDSKIGGEPSDYFIPERVIWAVLLCAVAEPKNAGQRLGESRTVTYRDSTVGERRIELETLWGRLDKLRDAVDYDVRRQGVKDTLMEAVSRLSKT